MKVASGDKYHRRHRIPGLSTTTATFLALFSITPSTLGKEVNDTLSITAFATFPIPRRPVWYSLSTEMLETLRQNAEPSR